jgi:hypothetical protein
VTIDELKEASRLYLANASYLREIALNMNKLVALGETIATDELAESYRHAADLTAERAIELAREAGEARDNLHNNN